ncbi:hypothetical protein IPZ70_02010 [Streptomyces polychromogenes]|nr:hypothetical protein [Streptomyces polychromogenes]
MSTTPASSSAPDAALADRIHAVTGHSVTGLAEYHERGLLDEPTAALADAHRLMRQAQQAVDYHREHVRRLLFDEPVVDTTVADRIDRSIGHLRQAAATRDTHRDAVLAALSELQSASPARPDTNGAPDLSAPDTAALLAIARGAKLHENLLTQRLSVITASGTRIAYSALQRLESAGLVARDTSRPVHAGVPLTLTEAGRATLTGPRRTNAPGAPPAVRTGAWPPPATRAHR